jgi:hypothetical protein
MKKNRLKKNNAIKIEIIQSPLTFTISTFTNLNFKIMTTNLTTKKNYDYVAMCYRVGFFYNLVEIDLAWPLKSCGEM